MNDKFIRWLYQELPRLVDRGVVSEEVSARLHDHYGEAGMSSGKKVVMILFGVLGGLLVGGGIILLFAHNWSELSRPARAVLSFAPLIGSQLLGAWVVARRMHSVAWREGVGSLLMLSIGACIALISQTYHMPGSFDQFLLVWMVLSLPVIYILRASTPAVFFMIGITSWGGYTQYVAQHALGFYALLALVLPHVWLVQKERRFGGAATLLYWSLALSVGVAIGITLEKAIPGLWIPIYMGYFTILYLVGRFWFADAPSFWQRPFEWVGGIGIAVLALILTYQWPWEEIGWGHHRYGWKYHEWASMFDYVLLGGVMVGAVTLLVLTIRRQKPYEIFWGAASLIGVSAYGVTAGVQGYFFAALLMNAYLFALGLGTLIHGVRTNQLGRINVGMLILASVIAARFFDGEFSILVRGLVFIALGAGFLVTNLVLLRKKGGAA